MKYTKSHEWIKIEGQTGVVGITAYAREELGSVVFAELPALGKKLSMGKEAAVLESTKAAADIYSPVSGEVLSVNSELTKSPNLINNSPEDLGWLFTIKIENPAELESLLTEEEYRGMIQS